MLKPAIGIAVIVGSVFAAFFLWPRAQHSEPSPVVSQQFGFGTTPSEEDLASFVSIRPDGTGLPPGEGTYVEGQRLYAAQCASCHGRDLRGMPGAMEMPPEMAAMGSDRLIGGRDTHTSANPVFTIESHWPYATTLWDYLKRTMPLTAPGSLSDDETYSLVAYILGEADIVPEDQIMNAESVPEVVMPNRDGFVGDPRPEPELQP
tara:strand:- start:152 stop:766 length:615 start_codon:yes stop_codon:yes gene_type:complete